MAEAAQNFALSPVEQQRAIRRLVINKGPIESSTIKPFTFDLGVQLRHVQMGKSWDDHRVDVKTYLAEMYAKARIARYKLPIKRVDGKPRVQFGNDDAEEVCMVPVVDPSVPQWYKDRALRDVFGIRTLNGYLLDSQTRDKFTDISPAPFNVPLEEREKFAFGKQGFVRFYEYNEDSLDAYAIRFELDKSVPEEIHQQMVSEISEVILGERFTSLQLEGRMGKLNPELTVEEVYRKVREVEIKYQKTTGTYESVENSVDVENLMGRLENWNKGIFRLMRHSLSYRFKGMIQKHFRALEMAFLDLVQGKENKRLLDFVGEMSPYDLLSLAGKKNELSRYSNQVVYNPGFGCDGFGSGFSGLSSTMESMTYQNMSANTLKLPIKTSEWFCKRCGACGKEINCEVRPGQACPGNPEKGIPSCGAVRKCA